MKPVYVEALWHNCMKCKIHYMSESPHIRAYLCDECWNSMPHYKTENIMRKKKEVKIDWRTIALYTVGNIVCLVIIGYYLWFK
jgi:uncharacterized Fe-S center protein